jgi:hypothetical protein
MVVTPLQRVPLVIASNLSRGNPVIVRVRLPSGITHFVVVAGKDGFDYLIADPGADSAKGLYPLARARQRHRSAAVLRTDPESAFAARGKTVSD